MGDIKKNNNVLFIFKCIFGIRYKKLININVYIIKWFFWGIFLKCNGVVVMLNGLWNGEFFLVFFIFDFIKIL